MGFMLERKCDYHAVLESHGNKEAGNLIDKDMTQADLARSVGTSPRYLGFILEGRRSPGIYEGAIRSTLGLDKNARKAS